MLQIGSFLTCYFADMYKSKIFFVLLLLLSPFASLWADDAPTGYDVPAIVENGDTIPFEVLPQVWVYPNPYDKYTSDRKRKLFWRMVRDIKRTYPYAKMIGAEVRKIELATKNMSDADRKRYTKSKENDLINRFKPQLKQITFRQGKMLIKLIDRECNKTSYELIQDYRGKTRAFMWQGFATLFGADLKSTYSKEENEVIEYVIALIDAGQL